MADFFSGIMGLTRTLVGAAIFILIVGVAARTGVLGDAVSAMIQIILLPVKLVGFLIQMGTAAGGAV